MAQRKTTTKRTTPTPKKKQKTSPRARARGRAPVNGKPPNREIIMIRCADIVIDDDWNARNFDVHGTGREVKGQWPEEPERELTDEQLIDSIRRVGLLQPPVVRPYSVAEGTYRVVAGSRRVRACVAIDPDWEIACMEEPERRRKDEREFFASAANLAENMNRRDLRPFEIADKLFRMHKDRADLTVAELAKSTSISKPYCYNLLRARRHASDQMWAIFSMHGAKYGGGITFKDFLAIVTKNPKGKQLEVWNALVKDRLQSGSRDSGASSSAPRPKALSAKQLEEYLTHVEPPKTDFEAGLRFCLLVALGREQWTTRASSGGPTEGAKKGARKATRKTNGAPRTKTAAQKTTAKKLSELNQKYGKASLRNKKTTKKGKSK